MSVRLCVPLLLIFAACAAQPEVSSDTTPDPAPDPVTVPGPPDVTCDPPGPSVCGDDGSVVRAVVAAGSAGPTTGDLVVYLTHLDLGEETLGGYYHTSAVYAGVDLMEGPVVVEVDMCEGGEMWPTEWGDYNLVVVLDQDGDNAPLGFSSNRSPGVGEPSARVSPVRMEAGSAPPCFDDVVLDCLDGADCVAY